jgi:hypothetical protein
MKLNTRDDAVHFLKRKRRAFDHYESLISCLERVDPGFLDLRERRAKQEATRSRLEALEVMFGLRRHDA